MPSTCIFGSTARSSVDSLSDRDMLIVAASELELAETSRPWSSAGWSVAKFTQQKIKKLADRGSLFLQHLKQEGKIVEDDDGFLASLFDGYQPKPKYEDDFCESLAFLSDLSQLPLNYWATLCSADIAYVAIRNIAITHLASRGIYTFDYADLIDHFAKEKCLSPIKWGALRRLRALKHGYRNRNAILSPRQELQDALAGAEELFGRGRRIGPHDGGKASGYWGLRMLDLDLVMTADPRFLDRLPAEDPLAGAWALIRDPRDYPKVSLVDDAWIKKITRLAERRFVKSDLENLRSARFSD